MLTEKDYCDYGLIAELEQLGMLIKIDFACGIENGQLVKTKFYPNPPTLYEAQKWLREEKKIIVEVFVDDDSDTPITYNIYKDGVCVCHHHGKYWSVKEWSEALSEGIKDAVKILKEDETTHR